LRGAALAAALVAGVTGGATAAWLVTSHVDQSAGRGPAPWKTMAGTGSTAAGLQQRATVARIGIWALPESEVIYFNTESDSDGRPLRADCDYILEARAEPRARWWSIGVYRDYFWIDNPADRYSLTSSVMAREPGGGYRVTLSAATAPGNWLPLGAREGRITLLFRLYQPDPAIMADPEAVPLPGIRRTGCR
jgi:hypothetical protein